MNWSYDGYTVNYRVDRLASPKPAPAQGWAVLDDFFPNLLTGFRIAEYNAYLQHFPRLTIFSTVADFDEQAQAYARLYPGLAPRVRQFSSAGAGTIRFAYLNFLNNAHAFLPYLERWNIPFVLTLYPGGGFGIDEKASDDKLARVCASQCLRRVIVTQRRTADYLKARHPTVSSSFVYGCVINPLYFGVPLAHTSFGDMKASFDICFVAERYMEHGLNKGYPTFIDACRQVVAAIPETRLHVIGGFSTEDWPLGDLEHCVTFHGRLATQNLRQMFAGMDVIASPNVPFTLHAGNFDGFPTAACAEASLCGVAMVVSDVLRLNEHYEPGRDLMIVAPEAASFASALIGLGRDVVRLRALALAGQMKSRDLFAPQRQIHPRIAAIEHEAAAAGVEL